MAAEMQTALDLGINGERTFPQMALADHAGDGPALIDLVAEKNTFAALDRLRYLIEKLDPNPGAGEMTGRNDSRNRSLRTRLLKILDSALLDEKRGLSDRARASLGEIAEKADGFGLDWVKGAAAKALIDGVDTASALLGT